MTTPGPALRSAVVALLTQGAGAAALVAAGVPTPGEGGVTVSAAPGQPLPYVEVQGTTSPEAERSTSTRSTSSTITLVARAHSLDQAEAIAAVLVEHLARRFLVAGSTNAGATLDLDGPAYEEDRAQRPPVWAYPVRLRYALYQTALPGE